MRSAPDALSPRAGRKAKEAEDAPRVESARPTRLQTDTQQGPGSLPRGQTSPRTVTFRDLVSPLQLTTLSNQEIARHEAFYDILLSERQYVDDLQTMQVVFAIPLSKGTVLSKPDVSSLLLNYEAILNTNRLFLAGLEEIVAPTKPFINEVGNVFTRFCAQFKLYVSYCANNSEVMERLAEFRASQFKFANFLDDPARRPDGKGFDYFLQLPIQRIHKYPVLIKALLGQTPEASSDHMHLVDALREYEALAEAVKDRTRRIDGMRKVAEVAVNIKVEKLPKNFDLKQLGRFYITEGPVRVAKGKKSDKELYWFLFSDLLLETKRPKNGKYSAVRATSLNTLLVKDLHTTDTAFDLVNTVSGIFHVTFDTRTDKATWMTVVERAIEAHQNAIEDKREKLQSARQQAQPNADLRASAPVLGTPGRDLPTLEAENKELRERLAKVDAEMAEIKAALLKEQELARILAK